MDGPCDDCSATGHHTFCGECGYDATRPEESPAWLDTEPVMMGARLLGVAPYVAAQVVARAHEIESQVYDLSSLDEAWDLFVHR